ncbi:MAG: sigma-70 family RNA polymerase sigma factor [Lachnospiraceae bacterium]|nr:sigma-70 family RNA polymerase sigma factor [Lachnospiraceae bacterium]
MNRAEFSEKTNEYRNQLYIVAFTVLRNEADAQDAVCSAILKAYEHLDQLKDVRKFKAWIITITRNEALQLKRKRLELPGDKQVEAMLPTFSDSYNELWDVIQSLSDEYRMVIVLFYYNDLSVKDISKMLEIPVGTVKSRLNRGREQIKAAITEHTGRGEGGE